MQSLINQSFDIFNIYGKKPEAVENIVSGFDMTLSHCSINDITDAFKEWMRDKSGMPTPSDIHKLVSRYQSDRTWENNREGPVRAAPRVEKADRVAWCGLPWDTIEERGFMPQVQRHLTELTRTHGKDKAKEYLKYLKKGPQNFPPKYETEGRRL